MRPIDADALRDKLHEECSECGNCSYYNPDGNCHIYMMLEILDDEPTIEAEPVRHGQWVKRKGVWGASAGVFVCSVCNSVAQSSYSEYCPGCGAKMEGEMKCV